MIYNVQDEQCVYYIEFINMTINFHPHAKNRIIEWGATEEEIILTVEKGERFLAKYGRTGFRRNFIFQKKWGEKSYNTKQLEVFAVKENNDWLVLTVITRYF